MPRAESNRCRNDDFDRIRHGRGLPEPHRQTVFRRRDGRYYLDADWPIWGVRVEIHGIPHSFVANWDQDLLRQNDIAIAGGLLVFSSYAVRRQAFRSEISSRPCFAETVGLQEGCDLSAS